MPNPAPAAPPPAADSLAEKLARAVGAVTSAELRHAATELNTLSDSLHEQGSGPYAVCADILGVLAEHPDAGGLLGMPNAPSPAAGAVVCVPREFDPVQERVAEAIYDAMREHHPGGEGYPWQPRGNSDMQEEARRRARSALDQAALSTPAPDVAFLLHRLDDAERARDLERACANTLSHTLRAEREQWRDAHQRACDARDAHHRRELDAERRAEVDTDTLTRAGYELIDPNAFGERIWKPPVRDVVPGRLYRDAQARIAELERGLAGYEART